MRKRKWKRWVLIGPLSLRQLAAVARNKGMRVIHASKCSMCVHNQIGLYGTSAQMRQTEKEWACYGHEITNRQPSYAFSCPVDIPEAEWVDSGKGGER